MRRFPCVVTRLPHPRAAHGAPRTAAFTLLGYGLGNHVQA